MKLQYWLYNTGTLYKVFFYTREMDDFVTGVIFGTNLSKRSCKIIIFIWWYIKN